MNNKEAIALADMLDMARQLTRWYLSLLKNTDMKHRFELNGIQLNSPLWIAAHLVWAENMLVLHSTGGNPVSISWLDRFQLGAEYDESSLPNVKDVLDSMKAVHHCSIQHIRSLSDNQLDEPNHSGISFGANTKRNILQHAIRHESIHAGHLGWICKLHGIKTV
jgi:hypothetical protein